MADNRGGNGVLGKILVAVVVALAVGGTSPWWWRELVGENGEPTSGPVRSPSLTSGQTPEPAPGGFRVVETLLRADPFEHDGPCPVTITFRGRISTAGGAGTVTYRFLRNDGASAPVEALSFDGPGSKSIGTTWTLGAVLPVFQPYEGWQAIELLDPVEQESPKARFRLYCR